MNDPTTVRRSPAPVARVVAVVVALILVTWVVIAQSRSAFSAQTDNSGNNLNTGEITLDNNRPGSVMFTADGLKPGDTESDCIEVIYTGTIGTGPTVKLYGDYVDSADGDGVEDGLSPYLDLVIEMGDADDLCAPTPPGTATTIYGHRVDDLSKKTLESFTTQHFDFDTALTGWTPTTGSERRAFWITMTVKSNAAMNLTAEPLFTWEVQSS